MQRDQEVSWRVALSSNHNTELQRTSAFLFSDFNALNFKLWIHSQWDINLHFEETKSSSESFISVSYNRLIWKNYSICRWVSPCIPSMSTHTSQFTHIDNTAVSNMCCYPHSIYPIQPKHSGQQTAYLLHVFKHCNFYDLRSNDEKTQKQPCTSEEILNYSPNILNVFADSLFRWNNQSGGFICYLEPNISRPCPLLYSRCDHV